MEFIFFLMQLPLLLVGVVAFFVYIRRQRASDDDIYIDGYVDEEFKVVRDAFKENFKIGWEREGAAVTVYYKGKKVVDIWGGYADREAERKWKEDTMSVLFSSTKGVSALCFALLVDRGIIRYDQKVVEFWPEFGKNGKDKITVEHILSHNSGLPRFTNAIDYEVACNPKKISEIIENLVPEHPPGEVLAYQSTGLGWLLDQMIRRIDPKGRDIGQFFKEEIADPYDIDFHIGMPLELSHRVARFSFVNYWQTVSEYMTNSKHIDIVKITKEYLKENVLMQKKKSPWVLNMFKETLNDPDLFTLTQCAVLGIGTARGIAKLFSLVEEGKIFSEKTLKLLSKPVFTGFDTVLKATHARGQGLVYITDKVKDHTFNMIGHAGHGGQNIKFSIEDRFSYTYILNGLNYSFGENARSCIRIRDSVYNAIVKIKEKESKNE